MIARDNERHGERHDNERQGERHEKDMARDTRNEDERGMRQETHVTWG